MNTKRLVDINGDIVITPEHYYSVLQEAENMIEKMESENVDRADMMVVLETLASEMKFRLRMLKNRD